MRFFPARLLTLAVLAVALIAGGCANPRKGLESTIGGAATPGSTQDFQVNVGDRVFFTVDSSALTPEAQQTLTRQAQWLNQYSQYNFVIEGHADERGTREYNLALGARRADPRLSDRQGHQPAAYPYDILRQGTSGRGLR
jgi:peptidoglycan-associated lipoprotein